MREYKHEEKNKGKRKTLHTMKTDEGREERWMSCDNKGKGITRRKRRRRRKATGGKVGR